MVKKVQKASPAKKPAAPSAAHVKDSAQQIWAAGLAAFTKAQNEGGKVYETLVKEGMSLQKKTQTIAEQKFGAVATKMTGMAGEVGAKAGQQWDKLESIFEERVAKALNRLGVPSRKDVDALIKRIDELSGKVGATAKTRAAAGRKAVKKVVSKAPAKRTARAKKAA